MLDLAAAEARLAALSVFAMLFLVIIAAAATIIGWGLLVVLGISLLEDAGWSWRWSTFAIALLHGLVAFVLWEVAARLSRNLTLPGLRQTAANHGKPGVSQ
jgi:MFS family permease